MLLPIGLLLVRWQVKFAPLGKLTCGTPQEARTGRSSAATLIAHLLVVVALAGCSRVSLQAVQMAEEKPPVEVDIPQAFNQQGRLKVKVSVRPLVNLRGDDVVVGVVGVGLGQPVEQFFSLSELSAQQVVPAGQVLLADFDIPSVDLLEYQVVCKWGEDRKRVKVGASPVEPSPAAVPQFTGAVRLNNLALRRIKGPCPPCDEVCVFEGEISNGLSQHISDVTLALGITFVPTGGEILHPAAGGELLPDEEQVILSGVSIAPGQSRAIEVKVPQPLAEIPEGQFVPYLRLLRH